MKKLVFILFSSVCFGQTDQYKQILLSKKTGREVRSYSKGYGLITEPKSGKSGIVDSLGTVTFDYPYKSEITRLWKQRFILKANGKTALIDEKGIQLIPLAPFKFRTWEKKDRLIYSQKGQDCVYDFQGKQIIPFSDKIQFGSESRFFVKNGAKWLLYDFDGKKISDREFTDDLRFYKGRTYLTSGEKSGEIIDNNGKTLSLISNHNIDNINAFPYIITLNTINNKYGIIDDKENVITDEIYDQAFVGREYIYLTKDDKISIFSKKEAKIYDLEHHYVNPLFNGLFKTSQDQKNPKTAVIRLNGEVVFPKEYDRVEGLDINGEKYLYLRKGDEEILLDKNLKSVLDESYSIEKIFPNNIVVLKNGIYSTFSPKDKKYKELKNFSLMKPFELYPALIGQNSENLYGMIDEEGNEAIPFIYHDIYTFLGTNEVVVKKDNKFGVTNPEHEPLTEIIYDKYTADKKGIKLIRGKESVYIYFTEQKDRNFID